VLVNSSMWLPPDERYLRLAFSGISVPALDSSVTMANFLRTAVNSTRGPARARFRQKLREKILLLKMNDSSQADIIINGVSSGEKKRAEILQMI